MSEEPTLFPTTPVPKLQPGDRAQVVTMWGTETGVVRDVHDEDGYPMVTLTLTHGDTVTVNVARVSRVEDPDTPDT